MYSIEQRDEQLKGTKAKITYEMQFDRASQHLVKVLLRVEGVTGPEVVSRRY